MVQIKLFDLLETALEVVCFFISVGSGHRSESQRDEEEHSVFGPRQSLQVDGGSSRGPEVVVVVDHGWEGEEDVGKVQADRVLVDLEEAFLFI